MKKIPSLLAGLLTASVILTACAPKTLTPDPNAQIRQAVAATIAAIPTPTAVPISTPYPSPTPFSLAGLFCEYQFCIGHPVDMAFFDVSAQQNPAAPSTYSQGLIAAFNGNLFIQVMWQLAPGASDPQFLMDLILDDELDTRNGTMDVKLVRGMNVMSTLITSIATPLLPFGAAAAWTCGDRVFAWKLYAPQSDTAAPIFEEALARFTCGQ
ncbi:MAG: hypothetical protein HZB19_05730 [Chloroflexi bacterium]|nr:hypothetical protein [Chloroflexota bacterium]